MYHEEHALPAFVHSRSRDQLRLPFVFTKGETPVIYFYTKVRQQVRVGVGFPRGVWTQWYPQAILVNPPLAQNAETPDHLSGGRICWQAEVIPSSAADASSRCRRPAATPCGTTLVRSTRRYVKTIDATKNPARPSTRDSCFTAAWVKLVLPVRLDCAAERNADARFGERRSVQGSASSSSSASRTAGAPIAFGPRSGRANRSAT